MRIGWTLTQIDSNRRYQLRSHLQLSFPGNCSTRAMVARTSIPPQLLSSLPSVTLPRHIEFHTHCFGKSAKTNQFILDYVQTLLAVEPTTAGGHTSDVSDNSGAYGAAAHDHEQVQLIRSTTSAYFVGHVFCMCSEGLCQRLYSFVAIHPSLLHVFPRVIEAGPHCQLNLAQQQARDAMSTQDQQIFKLWSQHNAAESNKQRSHGRVMSSKKGHGEISVSVNNGASIAPGEVARVNETRKRKRADDETGLQSDPNDGVVIQWDTPPSLTQFSVGLDRPVSSPADFALQSTVATRPVAQSERDKMIVKLMEEFMKRPFLYPSLPSSILLFLYHCGSDATSSTPSMVLSKLLLG